MYSLLELGFLTHWPNMTRAHFELQKSLQTAEINFCSRVNAQTERGGILIVSVLPETLECSSCSAYTI